MLSGLVTKPGQISLVLREWQAPEIDGPLQQQVECEESHSRHVGPSLTHLGVEGPEVRVTATVANDTISHRRRRSWSGARRRTLPFPVACRSIRRRSLSTSGLAAPVSRPEVDSHPITRCGGARKRISAKPQFTVYLGRCPTRFTATFINARSAKVAVNLWPR